MDNRIDDDSRAEFVEIMRLAAHWSAEAQRAENPDYLIEASLQELMSGKALELAGRLRRLLPKLDASGCGVTVSAIPPNIELSVNWDRPAS